ncbi:MAG: wax ester/triacylglycerol synthase domain-containing protein [Candidatus Nanopelagicales bacterium]
MADTAVPADTDVASAQGAGDGGATSANQAPAKKAPVERGAAKKAPAKKAPAKKAPAKRAPAKKASAKKAPAKKAPAKKAVAEQVPPEREPASAPTSGRKRAAAKRTARSAAGRAGAAVDSARSAGRVEGDPNAVAPRRLSGFDFATWRSASDDPTMRSPIIGLIAMASSPDWATLVDRFDRASRVAPVLRQKVVEGPSEFLSPRLTIDADFDLGFHMRRFRVSEPGTWDQVLDEARRQSMTEFDLARPLWQVTLIEGLADGRAAMLVKLHHAIADGQGAMMLGATVIDLTPAGADLGPMPPAPMAADLDTAGFLGTAVVDASSFLMKSVKEITDSALPIAGRALRDPLGVVDDVLGVLRSAAKFMSLPTSPMSPVMTGRSINYHFVTFDVPLDGLKTAAKAHRFNLNDAYMASVVGGLRIYHERRDEPVRVLRCNMPISLRDPQRPAQNAVTIARFEVPVHITDPAERMAAIHEIVSSWRKEPALHLVDPLAEVGYRLLPSDVFPATARTSDFTASNVPGVPMPVWVAGAPVLAMYPLTATIGAATNITLLSYNGVAGIGIAMDDAAIPDQDLFVECIGAGFAEVIGAPVGPSNPII